MTEGSPLPTPRSDLSHTLQLLRDLAIINARTVQALGPLPPGGLPMTVKRKPDLPRPAPPPAHVETEEDETMTWNPITATAVFAIAGTLAACAAEPSPAMGEAPVTTAVTALEPAVAGVSAHTAPVIAQTPAVAASEQAEPEYGPAIPAAQLRKQILDLIGSFQTLQDLERAHVEAIMRMPMTRIDGMRDGYYYTATTTAGWLYRVEVARLGPLSEPPTILVYLNNGVEPWTDQKPTYCTLNFESIAKELVALGYEQGPRLRRTAGKLSWGFYKEITEKKLGFGVDVYIYQIEDGSTSGLPCVRSFRIGGDSLHE